MLVDDARKIFIQPFFEHRTQHFANKSFDCIVAASVFAELHFGEQFTEGSCSRGCCLVICQGRRRHRCDLLFDYGFWFRGWLSHKDRLGDVFNLRLRLRRKCREVFNLRFWLRNWRFKRSGLYDAIVLWLVDFKAAEVVRLS